MLEERLGQAPQDRQGGDQRRDGDDAGLDGGHAPGTSALQTEDNPAVRTAARVQGKPAALSRPHRRRRLDHRLDPLARQGQANLIRLPGEIRPRRPMLEGAAAAVAEVGTGRHHPVGTGLEDRLDRRPAAAPACQDQLAWQGVGGEDGASGDPVALRPDRLDPQRRRLARRRR